MQTTVLGSACILAGGVTLYPCVIVFRQPFEVHRVVVVRNKGENKKKLSHVTNFDDWLYSYDILHFEMVIR